METGTVKPNVHAALEFLKKFMEKFITENRGMFLFKMDACLELK